MKLGLDWAVSIALNDGRREIRITVGRDDESKVLRIVSMAVGIYFEWVCLHINPPTMILMSLKARPTSPTLTGRSAPELP